MTKQFGGAWLRLQVARTLLDTPTRAAYRVRLRGRLALRLQLALQLGHALAQRVQLAGGGARRRVGGAALLLGALVSRARRAGGRLQLVPQRGHLGSVVGAVGAALLAADGDLRLQRQLGAGQVGGLARRGVGARAAQDGGRAARTQYGCM